MTDVTVTAMEPGQFAVTVTEGQISTSHRVWVPPEMLDDLGLGQDDQERVVRDSFEFLLEREPATSIMSEFSLDVIERYFADHPGELRRRLGLA